MTLKKKVTVSTWIELEELDGKVLTLPMTGKIEAEYNKRMGMSPDMRQEVTGQKSDGTDEYKNIVTIALDPVDAYNAAIWVMGKLIEGVEAKWDDGSDMVVNDDFFEAVIDGGVFDKWLKAAKEHGDRRAKAAEKN